MFDKKIEPIAMKYVRAKLAAEEAAELLELAKEDLLKVLPVGKYVTKDGDTVTHVSETKRFTFVADRIKGLVTPKVWKAIRIDAIDTAKLKGFLATGEVTHDSIRDGVDVIEVRSSIRVTWASRKPTTTSKSPTNTSQKRVA